MAKAFSPSVSVAPIHGWQLVTSSNDLVGSDNGTDSAISYGDTTNGAFFGGTSSKIVVPSSSWPNSYTLSFWVKQSVTSAGGYDIINKDDGVSDRIFASFMYATEGISTYNWNASGSFYNIILKATATDNTTLHHIAVVWDASANKGRGYVDGSQVGSDLSISGNAKSSSQSLYFGYTAYASGRWFKGNMRSIYLFQNALAASDITALYNSGTPNDYLDRASAVADAPFFGANF